MDGEPFGKVAQRVKAVAGIKAFVILSVATLHFAVMTRRIGANGFMSGIQCGGGGLKQYRQLPPTVGKTVGEFKTVVRLDTFHSELRRTYHLNNFLRKSTEELVDCSRQTARTRRWVNSSMAVY